MTDKTEPGVSFELIEKFQQNFDASDKNKLAQNVCTKHSIPEVCASRDIKQTTQHCFNHKIEKEGKPVTNQQQSGRCWIFAGLNCMRVPFMKKYGLEDFEFSATYLFFWDKFERANFLLDAFVDTAKKGEAYDGRLVSHLLFNPTEDGGQWDMLIDVVEKHGVVPKVAFPESENSMRSRRICRMLNNRLREYCMRLHRMVAKQCSESDIKDEKSTMLEEVYRILCICLGTPPSTVTFQYYTKNGDKSFQTIGPVSPRDFYHKHIKPDCFDMEDMVCLVNDPRPENPYEQLYTVDYLGNMSGGRKVLYINKPIEYLKTIAKTTICEKKQPVWFGCDVQQSFVLKDGFMDLKVLDYKLVFEVDTLKMTKTERLMYHDSLMTHAMVFTGVNTVGDTEEKAGESDKWRVENSWGETDGDKGYMVMTDDWFSEFVYEVVVSKKDLDEQTLSILQQEPKSLPAWDPMGALARC